MLQEALVGLVGLLELPPGPSLCRLVPAGLGSASLCSSLLVPLAPTVPILVFVVCSLYFPPGLACIGINAFDSYVVV